MMEKFRNISLGDTVKEYLPQGEDDLVYYRTFKVTQIYKTEDMDGGTIIMIGDDEESCSSNYVQRVPNP